MHPKYIYRHKTEKPLYEVSEGNMSVTVTEDHSLFNDKHEKIKPNEINNTKLEYYDNQITNLGLNVKKVKTMANLLKNGTIDRIPINILNADKNTMSQFLEYIKDLNYSKLSKTCKAGIFFIKNKVNALS